MGKRKENDAKKYDLEDRLIRFAVRIVNVVERLPKSCAGSHIAGQLVASGTSPAANYGEVQSSESRKDFVHKMKVCLKELRETRVWLLIIERKGLIKPADRMVSILVENNELISIFVASLTTAQGKR